MLSPQEALDVDAQRLAGLCQLTRTGRLVLAEQLSGLGKRQLLRIVTGQAQAVASCEFGNRVRQRELNELDAAASFARIR